VALQEQQVSDALAAAETWEALHDEEAEHKRRLEAELRLLNR